MVKVEETKHVIMKKIFLFLLISTGSTWAMAQWNNTFEINANSVYQLPVSNSMVEVVCTSPDQLWTVLPIDFGSSCGNRIWAHKTDISGNTLGSYEISVGAEVNLDPMAIEQFWADMFIAGSMQDCNTGNKDGFIMVMDNNGSFSSAVKIPIGGLIEILDIIPLAPKGASSSDFMAIGIVKDPQYGLDPISIVFDQGLTVLSTRVYHIPGDNIPHQGVLNSSGNVSIVGTETNTSNKKLFTMELDVNGMVNGPYMNYFNGSTEVVSPSICVQNNNLLITAGIEVGSGTHDFLVASMDQNNRTMNWSKTYDYQYYDEGLQVFDEAGDITVSFGSQDYSGNIYHGLMFLDANGNFNAAESYQSYNGPMPFATIQSSASSATYYQAGYSGSTLNLVEEGQSISSSCATTWSTSPVTTNFTDNQMSYTSNSLSSQSMTFYVQSITGDVYDCMGTSTTTFKKSATSIGSVNDLGLSVFPTASTDIINFNLETPQDGLLRVMSMEGKVLYSETFKSSQGSINISNLATGQYILSLSSENGESRSMITKL